MGKWLEIYENLNKIGTYILKKQVKNVYCFYKIIY